MDIDKDKINEFSRKYDAVVKPSHRVFCRANYGSTSVAIPSNVFDNVEYNDVACVNIQMPEDRFRALVEHDNWLKRKWAGFGRHGTEVMEILEQHERECIARHENPAVKKAYENYQMLLTMVEHNYS